LPKVEGLSVRDIVEDDIEALIALGPEIHGESIYHELDYDPDKFRKLALASLNRNNSMFCCFVADYKGKIIGVFAGIIAVHFFGTDMSASDLFLYIAKKYRATRAGASAMRLLITRYRSWAMERGATEITIRATRSNVSRKTQEFFHRMGYEENGLLFRKSVDQQ
jgi:GNAT superfamily N-acetyltransferase